MPRFVLLYHELPPGARPSHWDLMLERGDSLRTWALEQELRVGAEITCQALPDHRLDYLDYEGPVSNHRGQVTRVDRGTYETLRESGEELLVRLDGRRFGGELLMQNSPSKAGSGEANQSWVARFLRPESDA